MLSEVKRMRWGKKTPHQSAIRLTASPQGEARDMGMNTTNNPKLTQNAKLLRKSMTKEERKLWYEFLKDLPLTVNRQKVIGNYIVDFYCASAKLVIELDGSQHYEEYGKETDRIRDEYLSSLGLTVLRYSNAEINNEFRAVCEDIFKWLPQAWGSCHRSD